MAAGPRMSAPGAPTPRRPVLCAAMGVYQMCVLAGVALTSPTFVTMTSLLTIPLSVVWDAAALGFVLPPAGMAGLPGYTHTVAPITAASWPLSGHGTLAPFGRWLRSGVCAPAVRTGTRTRMASHGWLHPREHRHACGGGSQGAG